MIAPASKASVMDAREFSQFTRVIGSIMVRPKTRPAFQVWVEEMVGKMGENFISHRDPDGKKWKPLKNPRPKNRNHRWPHPLIDTGSMMKSVIQAGAKGHIEQYEDTKVTLGTRLKYAKYHQHGTGKIPKRKFLGINKEMAELASTVLGNEAFDQINVVRKAIGRG